MKKNTKQKLFCSQCSTKFGDTLAKFNTNFAFNLHLSTLHKRTIISIPNNGKKYHKCEKCDYTSSNIGHINAHISSVHEGQKPFKCENCGKSFSNEGNMNRHVATVHVGKKTFSVFY